MTIDDTMCYSHGVDAILRAKEVDAGSYTEEERFHLQQEFSMESGQDEMTTPTNNIASAGTGSDPGIETVGVKKSA